MKDAFIEVGRVVGTHGVRGGIKVKSFSGDPSGLLAVTRVRLRRETHRGEREERDFERGTAQRVRGCAVLSLEGIGSPEEAAAWLGATVHVRREDLPPPAEDEYYWADLVGCEVVDAFGSRIGTVARVEPGPAHDWLAVRRGGGGGAGGEEAYLPVVEAFIRKVDVAGRRIVVSPPEGWD
jgi:16S rRNA processing protein RimM